MGADLHSNDETMPPNREVSTTLITFCYNPRIAGTVSDSTAKVGGSSSTINPLLSCSSRQLTRPQAYGHLMGNLVVVRDTRGEGWWYLKSHRLG
jgi:hypothetical protein